MDSEIFNQLPVPQNESTRKLPAGIFRYIVLFAIGIVIGMFIWVVTISRPPRDFVADTVITVYSGMSSRDLASVLQEQQIIRSAKWFRFLLATRIREKPIVAGDYIFEKPPTVFSALYRITRGIYGSSRIKVTFPEGITVKNMADILSKNIPNFPVSEFLMNAKDSEGFLFPETYYFFRTTTPEQVVTTLSAEFRKNMQQFSDLFSDGQTRENIYGRKRSERDIIIMASILEREANDADEAKIISGILWKRLQKNIPLQVDATFLYTIQKGSSELTISDLRKDGPYNTYTRAGLPAGPIGNPGTAMINAALHPQDSPYFYYLHGDDGKIRYAKTYQEHLVNKQKYLK